MSISESPEGFSRWSMRLLADKVVELDYIDSISHETIRQVLKKTKLNPGAKSVNIFGDGLRDVLDPRIKNL